MGLQIAENPSLLKHGKVPKFGVRHEMTILLHTFLLFMFTTRVALSLAIVAMTDSTVSPNPDIPTYSWTNTGVILSAFFWSYVVLQPFSGYFLLRFGLRKVIFVASMINSVTFLITPFLIFRWEVNGLIFCRVIQGLCYGFFYPAVFTAFGLWIPIKERSMLSMIIQSSLYISFILSNIATGYICASSWGWPAVFYIYGALCILWAVIWWVLASDSPKKHPRITEGERKYIEESLETVEKKENNKRIPFKAILCSLPFWCGVVANIGGSWMTTITETQLPTYLKNIMNLDMVSNGIITASPSIVQLVVMIPLAPLGDFLVSRNVIALMTWRRIAQSLATFIPALAIIWLAFIGADQKVLAMVLLNIGLGLHSIMVFGSTVCHVDLSPRLAGVTYCIDNTITQILCIFAPIVVQYVVTDLTNIVQWRTIFLSMMALNILTSLFYMIFGSASIQWWNNELEEEKDNKITN